MGLITWGFLISFVFMLSWQDFIWNLTNCWGLIICKSCPVNLVPNQLLRKCFIKGTNGLLSGWKIWLHSIELIMANCYWFWPVSCSDVAAHMIRRTSCQLKLTYFFKIIHLIGFKGLSTCCNFFFCCTCMLFHIAAFFQCILCRTLQSIWRPYISNAVNVANAVYMKVQLHQGDSLIHGYL